MLSLSTTCSVHGGRLNKDGQKGFKSMSLHERDGLMDCLFSRQDRKLVNIKFARGSSDVISNDEFRSELCAAAARKKSGEVKRSATAPRCKLPTVDLREFVANM